MESNKDKSATILGEENYWGKDGIDWYSRAESDAEGTYEIIAPIIKEYVVSKKKNNRKTWLDFGCGEGRIIAIVKNEVDYIYGCDINKTAIDKCIERFSGDDSVHCFQNANGGIQLKDQTCDVIYSIGTMVHFNLREVYTYLKEFYRILLPGGVGIIHHSNWRETEDYLCSNSAYSSAYRRGDVGATDISNLCNRIGFEVLIQNKIPWGVIEWDIDCITVCRKAEYEYCNTDS